MTDFMQYVASGGTSERPSEAELDALLKRFEWFATARRVRALVRGERDERLDTYRKLSLLNPEKSVYFAELIGRIETNN